MKKYIFIAIATLFAFSFTISAQNDRQGNRNGENQGGGQRVQQTAEQRAERLSKQLDLTDAQKVQLVELYKKQDTQREEMMKVNKGAKTTVSQEERKVQFEASRKAWDTELTAIIGQKNSTKCKLNELKECNNVRVADKVETVRMVADKTQTNN